MQEIVQGIVHLPEVIAKERKRKLFLVTDASYPFLSIRSDVEALAMEKVVFSDFTSNPVFEDVCKGVRLFRESGCEALMAIGGGSAIDVAKCIKMAVTGLENVTGKDLFGSQQVNGSTGQRVNGLLPFIAIPTTAGTGSESTHNAVMYYEGAKQTLTNDGILPDYAVLEPSVLKTLPLYQKKCTMLDALCQGIESWWSVNATDESRHYAKAAVEGIVAHWEGYIFENSDEAAAQTMLAANYGGRAINISATTAAHAMSYKITSLYGLPHGHAVAVCLPEIWEYMIGHSDKCIDPKGVAYMQEVFADIAHALGCGDAREAVRWFRRLMQRLGMQNPVGGNREEELTVLSRSVNPVRLKNNPVAIDEQTARMLYEHIVR